MQNAVDFINEAHVAVASGADIVVGSEMMLCPYVSGDTLFEDDTFVDDMWDAAMYVVSASKDFGDAVLIFGGIAIDTDVETFGEDGRRRKYNAAFVVQHGRLISNDAGLSFAIKSLLPNYRIFDDARHFFSLRALAAERQVPLSALQKPFQVTIRGTSYRLGVMLCEDMWDIDYAEKPSCNLAESGADVLINISCSPWSWRKNKKRDEVIREICMKVELPFVYVNNVGCQNNGKNFIVFDGASTTYAPRGDIHTMAERYTEETCLASLRDVTPMKREEPSDTAELFQAVTIATRGYLDTLPKSVASRVVIGVSGGMDSALSVAFFSWLLGSENVIAINMPYRGYNAEETQTDARLLCERLGVHYRVQPIEALVQASCDAARIEAGTAQHKTAQAMARMHIIASIASQENAFFTCNANMSEIAFGYGTLNGDLRGTFAPWMNCLKQDVYRLGDYMNRVIYEREVISRSIIDRPPMDELALDTGTNSRNDPFDYGTVAENGYHDQMVRAIVVFRRSAAWFIEMYLEGRLEDELQLPEGRISSLFRNDKEWLDDLERCFTLFHGAVFKRIQSVPGPLVDKRSFGWDFRESILPRLETERYCTLKEELLTKAP